MTEAVRLEHDWFPRPLPSNVAVGDRSWIYSSYAFLHCRSERDPAVRIGKDTGIYIGTMFDLGTDARLDIGDYCTIAGPIISTDRGVTIGDYAFISYDVVIADEPHAAPLAPSGEPGDVVIGENAWIGTRAVILGGARLGTGAVVGAATVVDFEVPAYAIVAGSPARVVGSAPPRERSTIPNGGGGT